VHGISLNSNLYTKEEEVKEEALPDFVEDGIDRDYCDDQTYRTRLADRLRKKLEPAVEEESNLDFRKKRAVLSTDSSKNS